MSDYDPREYETVSREFPEYPAELVRTVVIDGVAVDILRHRAVYCSSQIGPAYVTDHQRYEAARAGEYTLEPASGTWYVRDGKYHKAGAPAGGGYGVTHISRGDHRDAHLAYSTTVAGAVSGARKAIRDAALHEQYGPVAVANVRTLTSDEYHALPTDQPINPGDLVAAYGHQRYRVGVAIDVNSKGTVRYLFATPTGGFPIGGSGKGDKVRLYRAAEPAAPVEIEAEQVDADREAREDFQSMGSELDTPEWREYNAGSADMQRAEMVVDADWTERYSAGWSGGEVTVIRDLRAGVSGPDGTYPAATLDEAEAALGARGFALTGPWEKHSNGHFAPLSTSPSAVANDRGHPQHFGEMESPRPVHDSPETSAAAQAARAHRADGVPCGEPVAEVTVDQTRIDAPAFPRDLSWWRGFVPCWVGVSINPDGTVRITADSKPCITAVHRWLIGAAGGRLADAVSQPGPLGAARGAGPADDPTVWVSVWRRRADYHRIADETTSGCGRRMLIGNRVPRSEVIGKLDSKPCPRCYPDGDPPPATQDEPDAEAAVFAAEARRKAARARDAGEQLVAGWMRDKLLSLAGFLDTIAGHFERGDLEQAAALIESTIQPDAAHARGDVDPVDVAAADQLADQTADALVCTWILGESMWSPEVAEALVAEGLLEPAGEPARYRTTGRGARVAALLPVPAGLLVITAGRNHPESEPCGYRCSGIHVVADLLGDDPAPDRGRSPRP